MPQLFYDNSRKINIKLGKKRKKVEISDKLDECKDINRVLQKYLIESKKNICSKDFL